MATRPCRICGKAMIVGPGSLTEPMCHPCRREIREARPLTRRTPAGRGVPRVCPSCGREFLANCSSQKTCGRECARKPQSTPIFIHSCPVCETLFVTPNPIVRNCVQHRGANYANRKRTGGLVTKACPNCGDQFSFTHTGSALSRRRCSNCRIESKRRQRHRARDRRRTRTRAQWVEDVNRSDLYERDGWICGICGDPVDQHADPQTDWAPSLDHVVPLSQGGDHSYANSRTAHRWCNSVRGDSDLNLRVDGQRAGIAV